MGLYHSHLPLLKLKTRNVIFPPKEPIDVFGHLTRMPPKQLPLEVLRAVKLGGDPWVNPELAGGIIRGAVKYLQECMATPISCPPRASTSTKYKLVPDLLCLRINSELVLVAM